MSKYMRRINSLILCLALTVGAGCSMHNNSPAGPGQPRRFASPQRAADEMIAAVQASDRNTLIEIFGADSQGILNSGDAVADKNAYQQFSEEIAKKHSLEPQGDNRYTMLVGDKEWPF